MGLIARYTHWIHGQWPAGDIEPLPEVDETGMSSVTGLYIVGDLTGIPLLKFAADTGARAVRHIAADPTFQPNRDRTDQQIVDIAIIGAGVSGTSAALEARQLGLSFVLAEAREPFSTLVNFPRRKPIFTYPTDMEPVGDLRLRATSREELLVELRTQTLDRGITPTQIPIQRVYKRGGLFEVTPSQGDIICARRVIVAIGRSGNFRSLDIPGEELDKVSNRLHDPRDYSNAHALVIGGGDSAIETAIALAESGSRVTLVHRKEAFSRPKQANVERLNDVIDSETISLTELPKRGTIRLYMGSTVQRITPESVIIRDSSGSAHTLANDVVFSMIGREAPLDFFRRSNIAIRGEMRARQWVLLGLFMAFCFFLYNWKAGGDLTRAFEVAQLFPFNVPAALADTWSQTSDRTTLAGILSFNLGKPGFWYSLLYSALVVIFGLRRVRRRRTPYVQWQTASLVAFQVLPLFLLPYIVLPYLGYNGAFDSDWGRYVADALFPVVPYDHGREYWRAFGLILAWPLFVWNAFSGEPMSWWLAISFVQTFVVIPAIVYFWGKGAYCGWICSCGALAETLGDTHRHKMPHGPGWNRANMIGQVILLLCFIMLFGRVASWLMPNSTLGDALRQFYEGMLYGWQIGGVQLNYRWSIDLLLAGVVGYGAYFWYSGRVWCRFACPLAALMHIYARFSRFRIFAEKEKCISCTMCTSVCHQGIDVMNFANKGEPMADPQCVRCSACVQTCPTGVLTFGQIDTKTGQPLQKDRLSAAPVHVRED